MASDTRRSPGLRILVVLTLIVGFGASLVWSFQLGFAAAFAVSGAALLAYTIPATIFDWPRFDWEDVLSFSGWLIAAIASALWALIGW